jgi:tetratricopeptide (TPR) repeat protein
MKDSFCPSCGVKNKQDSKFCTNCGTQLEQKTDSEKVNKEQPKKSNSFILLLFAFVLSIIAIVLITNSNQKSYQNKLASKVVQNPQNQENLNNMMTSIQDLRKELNANPQSYELNVKMANNFFDIGRFPDAVKHYQIALKINNSDPNVLIDLGVAYFNINASDSALNYINEALKINPNHPQGLYNSGIVHFNMGDSLGAVKMWEKLIKMNSDTPQAQTAKKFIDQLKNKITKS